MVEQEEEVVAEVGDSGGGGSDGAGVVEVGGDGEGWR